jgi:hypothetical protein
MDDILGQRSNRMRRRTIAAIPLILVLASRNLFHDRIRFVATTVGVVFSVILVTVQLGLYVSCERMITAMIDRAQADLWIVPMNAKSFEDNGMLEGQERFQALSTPGVTDAIPLLAGFSNWRKPTAGLRRLSSSGSVLTSRDCDHGILCMGALTISQLQMASLSIVHISSDSASQGAVSMQKLAIKESAWLHSPI